ncbi:MAG: glutathione-independent formaldehyde dehydrogenase [Thermoplasmata archaeon]|nr:glutathione-independent formaldehyde dehydrogenase [Thermoplasmata archaeon]
MDAIVYEGKKEMRVKGKDAPRIAEPHQAILRVTSTGICGSDLHMYEGRTDLEKGKQVGHEIMGVVEEVGEAVASIQVGDRVVLPFNIACGFCRNCHRGFTNACLTMNPDSPSAAYGYAGMGPYKGGQAERVLVPHADFNCLKVPGEPFDEREDDFLLLSDVFPTGYHGATLAQVSPGKTVAVFGAGPVGLAAAHSALLKGASVVYCVDFVEARLAKAKELGAIPIDIKKGDPVEQIREHRKRTYPMTGALRPGEEKFLAGVDCAIDAVGYQARDDKDTGKEKPTQVLENAVRILNAGGCLGIVGVYLAPDPGAKDEKAKQGVHALPLADFFQKGLTIGMGQCPVKAYNEELRDLILAGRAKPGRIVSHHVGIDEAPEAYAKFDKREDGYVKVVIRFEDAA